MNALLFGLSFLTRLPLPAAHAEPGVLGRAARYWPLAGGLVALCGLLALAVGGLLVSPATGAAMAVGAMAWATGGLHLDGLSDCMDATFANGDAERRLAVMHDPRAGALGAAGTALWLVLKVALVHACIENGTAATALWVAVVLSRAALPALVALTPAATPGKGLFAALKGELTTEDAAIAGLFGLVLVPPALLVAPSTIGAFAVGTLLAAAAVVAWLAWWRARVGGANGDVMGGAVEIQEAVLLAAFASPLLA